jgi:GT2 family glycosyltransferase
MISNITAIMMVCYNRLPLTQQTLESLFTTTDAPFRLCIVDNGSSDDTPNYLQNLSYPKDKCVSYQYQLNNENKGVAIGRNQAMKLANQYDDPFLATIDNDVVLPSQWLSECLDIMTANPNFSIGVNFEPPQYVYPPVEMNKKRFLFKKDGNLGTAAMVFPRRLHNLIGYFNHMDYNFFGEEDADWGMRSRLSGFKLGYLTRPGTHLGSGDNDKGEYRAFKDHQHQHNLATFQKNCYAYARKEKPIYIAFDQ